MKQKTKILFILLSLFLVVGFFLYQVQDKVLAEQSGSSPESGVTSRIKTIYDSLVTLSHGSESAGGWGNWGVMWNRIRSAAEWVPADSATESDVASGKTFHNTSRSQKTGTANLAMDFSTQSKVTWEDYKNGASADGDSAGEEATWTNTKGAATTGVWQDGRTGLYWSASQGSFSNIFTVSSCGFFSNNLRGDYTGGDGTCGNAINYCAGLSLDSTGDATSETNWYLPSQKELMQAYLDGIYNQTNATFVSTADFWSSTEVSSPTSYAWNVNLNSGLTDGHDKSYPTRAVRCVRRD